MSDPEVILLASIREKWGALIDEAVSSSSLPACYLAALVSLESGGKFNESRYESNVYEHLKRVAQGQNHSYGSIDAHKLNQEAELLYTDSYHREALNRALTEHNRQYIAAAE